MNYANYEKKIVEAFEVALVGWPLDGRVCNPGHLGCSDLNTLSDALSRGVCKWVALTPEEAAARRIDNQQRSSDGEQVYGPPRKPRARNVILTGEGDDGNDGEDGEDGNDGGDGSDCNDGGGAVDGDGVNMAVDSL